MSAKERPALPGPERSAADKSEDLAEAAFLREHGSHVFVDLAPEARTEEARKAAAERWANLNFWLRVIALVLAALGLLIKFGLLF